MAGGIIPVWRVFAKIIGEKTGWGDYHPRGE